MVYCVITGESGSAPNIIENLTHLRDLTLADWPLGSLRKLTGLTSLYCFSTEYRPQVTHIREIMHLGKLDSDCYYLLGDLPEDLSSHLEEQALICSPWKHTMFRLFL